MSRVLGSPLRPLAVWLVVSLATVCAVAATPGAWRDAGSRTGADAVTGLVVATCATALAIALAWLWLVTTATVVDLLRGRASTGGATRRLVLLACGVAVVAGTSLPAVAADGDGRQLLVGLSLPDRAVAPAAHHAAASVATTTPAGTYVVRPGDSLSSIALAHPGDGSLEDRWRAIWRTNRDVVGDNPDLIHPGQALRLPGATDPRSSTDQDGDRS